MKFAPMFKCLVYTCATLLVLSAHSCKKDVLYWSKVQKLNSNTISRLNKIRFINDSICIVAGGLKWTKSDILRSPDGGYTWVNTSVPDAEKGMYGIGTSPDGTLYLCGADGDVLYSKDAGINWAFKRILDWNRYTSLAFPTIDTGIFIASLAQDTGFITFVDSNFNIIDSRKYGFGLNEIYMVDQTTGYVIGYGAVMKTSDGGNTWATQDVVGDNFTAMDIHGEEIWMCGYNGSIYYTSNGGNTWTKYRNGNDITLARYHLSSILFTDELNGWAIGEEGKVIHSDDGGRHWAEYKQFTTSTLRSIALCPNGDLLLAGDEGVLYRITP